MTAVLASYVKLSTMVDGTLRVVLDIEPKAAADAFALLGSPGTPIAIARITDAAAVAHDTQQPAERKPLSLASKVALVCNEPSFWAFCQAHPQYASVSTDAFRCMTKSDPEVPFSFVDYAAGTVRRVCNVNSRSEIKEGSGAHLRWKRMEADYRDWQRQRAA